jgi:hypothetical protein
MIFALITVVITVHLFVFYNLYFIPKVELGCVYDGAYIFGIHFPVWGVLLAEFVCAYTLEVLMGSPCSFKLACRVFDPRKSHPMIFESAIICATVGIMCPAMSLLATFLYYDYSQFAFWNFCATYLCTVLKNFPLAFFSQLFFIQPLVRTLFKLLLRKDIARQTELLAQQNAMPVGETFGN